MDRLDILPVEKNGYDHALNIPKYGINTDIKYFNYKSLVRMYGKNTVDSFLRDKLGKGKR